MKRLLALPWDETGASAVEYSLLLAGIALAVAGSLAVFGTAVRGLFESANALFP